jgi:hypothetical protein
MVVTLMELARHEWPIDEGKASLDVVAIRIGERLRTSIFVGTR